MSVTIDDMYGNKIELGKAVADRAVSITVNEPKFGREVLVRLGPEQARDFAQKILEAVEDLG